MALPTVQKQSLIDAALLTDEAKAWRFVGEVKKVDDICLMIVAETNPGPTTAYRLVQLQSSLFAIKAFISANGLTAVGPRTVLAAHYPERYANAAAVLVDVQAANTAFNSLTLEFEQVLAAVRAGGQIIDCNQTTGELVNRFVTAAETASLRALAQTVADSLG